MTMKKRPAPFLAPLSIRWRGGCPLGAGEAEQLRKFVIMPLLALVIALLTLRQATPATAQTAIPRDKLNRALLATVFILVPDNNGDPNDSGSGTILDAQNGYILTNFHVMGDGQQGTLYNDQGLAIIGVMPTNLRSAPVLKYRAVFVAGDPELDLAVLKIVATLDNPRGPLPNNLGLTAIGRGDSEELMIGDELTVIGYPGLGGNTVTFTSGVVAGFLDDNQDGVFEWIKTDAEMNHGNSGGLATDKNGDFIGIPSAGVSDAETVGKISLVRLGKLALDFYDGVMIKQGNAHTAPTPPPTQPTATAGTTTGVTNSPHILSVQFGSAVSRANTVANPAVRFNSGLTALYAAFQFDNFRNGQSAAVVWYVNGFEDSRDSYEWNEGRTGNSWVSITNDKGLPDGFYELEIMVERQSLYRSGVVIGKAKQTTCQFGPLIFSSEISEAEQPINPAVDFTSMETVYAFFSATGVANGTPWRTRWSLNGQEVLNNEDVWDAGEAKSYWINIKEAGGLPNGDYKLELFCNNKLVQSGTFRVTERVRQQATGVSVTGVVYDADNQQQIIEGATVYFLQPGVSVSEWSNGNFPDSQLYGYGVSNSNGEYQLDTPVQPGQSYSVVVVQDAYQAVTEDNYTISTDAGKPFVLDVPMQSK